MQKPFKINLRSHKRQHAFVRAQRRRVTFPSSQMTKLIPCRDCGEPLRPDARGCPRCARNIEAERMLTRALWLAAAVFACVCVLAYVLIARLEHT
jgi:hypothetical protein